MNVLGCRLISEFDESRLQQAEELLRREWWARSRAPERSLEALKSSRLYGLVEGAEDRLIAFARVLDDGVFKALLLDVVVATERRGQGLGPAFLKALLETPELAAIDHIELYCEPALESFYQALGFSSDAGGARFMRLERSPSPKTPDQKESP